MDQLSRTRAFALTAGEGWPYRFGIDFTIKAGEVREGGGAAFVQYASKHGEEPPPHTHDTEDDMFELEKGGFIFLPHGAEYGYTIRGADPVQLIAVTSPVRSASRRGWGGFVADFETGQGKLIARPSHED